MSDFRLIQATTRASSYDGEFKWASAGMGYITVLPSGRLLVIDGGHFEDAENFIGLLEEYGGERPEVAAWIITHPHGDHMHVLYRILTEPELAARLTIGDVLCNGPAPEDEPLLAERLDRPSFSRFCLIRDRAPSLVTPHAGDEYDYDGARLKFFFTQDNIPLQDDYNKMSLVFSLTLGQTRVMFTGDAYSEPLQWVTEHFPGDGDLRADICQLAHHALNGGNTEFYDRVGADAVLVPSSKSGHLAMHTEQYLKTSRHSRHAEDMASVIYFSFDGTQEIKLK